MRRRYLLGIGAGTVQAEISSDFRRFVFPVRPGIHFAVDLMTHSADTGPFMLAQWRRDSVIRLQGNPRFHSATARPGRLPYITSSTTRHPSGPVARRPATHPHDRWHCTDVV